MPSTTRTPGKAFGRNQPSPWIWSFVCYAWVFLASSLAPGLDLAMDMSAGEGQSMGIMDDGSLC